MKKTKLILPFAALATVPAIAMPLTACNKVNYFNMTLDCSTLEGEKEFSPYDNKFDSLDHRVDVRDAIPNYINEFDDINKAIGRDIIYNAYMEGGSVVGGDDKRIIKIKDCFFDTYEWRLSNELWINDPAKQEVTYISVSRLKYSINPHAQHEADADVRFAPLGVAGAILEDPYWTIKIIEPGGKTTELNNKTTLSDWNTFWTTGGGDKYLCFQPKYYKGIKLK